MELALSLHLFHFRFEDGHASGQPLPEILGGFIHRCRFPLKNCRLVSFPFGAPIRPNLISAADSCHERQHDGL